MQAHFIAILLSFFIVLIPAHADTALKNSQKQPLSASSKINLNQADLSTLVGSFKGIGKKRAEAIIAYRESHNGFKSLEELADVKGFSPRFIDNNREKLKEIFIVN